MKHLRKNLFTSISWTSTYMIYFQFWQATPRQTAQTITEITETSHFGLAPRRKFRYASLKLIIHAAELIRVPSEHNKPENSRNNVQIIFATLFIEFIKLVRCRVLQTYTLLRFATVRERGCVYIIKIYVNLRTKRLLLFSSCAACRIIPICKKFNETAVRATRCEIKTKDVGVSACLNL